MVIQGQWLEDPGLRNVPYFTKDILIRLKSIGIEYLPQILERIHDFGIKNLLLHELKTGFDK